MARPALSEEERFSRRAALLDAARHLYREQGTLPTVSNIAKAAGIAKGAVYLWVRSKEEIFVALLEAAFLDLLMRLIPVIESLDSRPEFVPDNFATQYEELLGEVPDAVQLASIQSSIFKENLPVASFSRLNGNVGAGLSKVGALLEQRFGSLIGSRGADLLLRTWTLTVGMWLTMDIPDEMKKVLHHPALAIFHRGFSTELKTAVAQLWRGAMIPGEHRC
jgi:AcrR family transcriptional regulator